MELLGVDDALQALVVVLQRLEPVEAGELPLVGLAHDLVRDALLAVVLRRDRAHHLARELAAVLLPLEGLVTQAKVHSDALQGFGRRMPLDTGGARRPAVD